AELLLKLCTPSFCFDDFRRVVIGSVRNDFQCNALVGSSIARQENGSRHTVPDRLDDLVWSKLLEYGLHGLPWRLPSPSGRGWCEAPGEGESDGLLALPPSPALRAPSPGGRGTSPRPLAEGRGFTGSTTGRNQFKFFSAARFVSSKVTKASGLSPMKTFL